MQALGKVSRNVMEKIVYHRLGEVRREVVVGPKFGVDNAVVKIGGGNVMVVTTDPLSAIPALGLKDSAWLSVHLLASDVTTSGFPPAYVIVDFNLPPHMRDEEFSAYWISFDKECKALGAMVIGGHTGRFQGCDYTIVGGGTMIAVGPEEKYLSSNMASEGDVLIVTKGAAIAATGILSRTFPKTVASSYGTRFLKKAQRYFYSISTVKDALISVKVGVRENGVKAMHDATEGGVLAALYEMAEASGLGAIIDKESIPLSREAESICNLFALDPYIALSEGTLVASISPDFAEDVLRALEAEGIVAATVGRTKDRGFGVRVKDSAGEKKLKYPGADPYWRAYWKAIKRKWR